MVVPIPDARGTFYDAWCPGTASNCGSLVPLPATGAFGTTAGDPDSLAWYGSLLWAQRDPGTGLEYRRNRHYDPGSGRFIQADPIGLAGGLNAYGFAASDPVNLSDPFGLFDCDKKTGEGCSAEYKRLLSIDRPLEDPGAADPVFLAAGGLVGAPEEAAGEGAVKLISRIGESRGLTRIASVLEGEVQSSVDRLTAKLAKGNLNPGIGTRHLFNGILEARARDGARVYFRNAGNNVIEILAKSTKATQDQAIKLLRELYK